MDRPPFDPVRFACYLLAGILSVECIIILAGALSCLWYMHTIISDPKIECDPKGRLTDLLQSAMSAALALLAGFNRGGGGSPPPGPPKGP